MAEMMSLERTSCPKWRRKVAQLTMEEEGRCCLYLPLLVGVEESEEGCGGHRGRQRLQVVWSGEEFVGGTFCPKGSGF